MSVVDFQYLDWDSEQLGLRCGLIDLTASRTTQRIEGVEHLVKNAIREAKDIEFVTIKLPSHCNEAVSDLVRYGTRLIDTELTFFWEKSILQLPWSILDNCQFEFCRETDSQPFVELAEEMQTSRFFQDFRIPETKAIHLWRSSIRNQCEGFADELLVVHADSRPAGIVTLKFQEPGEIYLQTVGVLRNCQRKGIGRLMLNAVRERYGKEKSIYVDTYSINVAAQRLYQAAGFKYYTLKYVLHSWRDERFG
jgi:ribosomal protein S18 acetylase RimI-like enzyme